MHCRHCRSEGVKKNGHDRKRKQMYLCKSCGRAFVEAFEPNRLTAEDHRFILKHYAEGVGIRAIARLLGKTSGYAVWAFLKKQLEQRHSPLRATRSA